VCICQICWHANARVYTKLQNISHGKAKNIAVVLWEAENQQQHRETVCLSGKAVVSWTANPCTVWVSFLMWLNDCKPRLAIKLLAAKLTQTVMFLAYIREKTSSNLDRGKNYSDWDVSWFTSDPPGSYKNNISHEHFFSINHSLTILRFDVLRSEFLTSWKRILEKPLVAKLPKKYTNIYGTRRSLPCTYKPSTGSYSQPDESNPFHHILILWDPS
jgi:hypothetical protein